MSLKKSTRRRLALFTSSSLVAASLSVFTFAGAALTPASAFAADECTPVAPTLGNGSGPVSDDPTLNGATADSFACSETGTNANPVYTNGITYSSQGDLTVTKSVTGITRMGANGITLTGNGADDVTWDSSAGTVIVFGDTSGPILDVTTATGNITITTASISSNAAATNVTHGIRATSTGAGDISITRNGSVNNNVAGGQAAIEAVTNGGDISVTAQGGGNTQGRLRGIFAQTSGAGTINISTAANLSASATDGIAAIDTIAGSGLTTIVVNGGGLGGTTVDGGAGAAIRSVSSGAVVVQQSDTAFTTITGRVDFSGVAGGVTWDAGRGRWQATGASLLSGAADTMSLSGGSLASGGSIDFGGGGDTLDVTGSFTADGDLTFGAGADRFDVSDQFTANGAQIDFGTDADALAVIGSLYLDEAAVDFGAGADTLSQDGILSAAGVSTLSNLEAFDNTGSVYLGSQVYLGAIGTDGVADDVLQVTDGVFTGSGESRIFLDANLGVHGSQVGCATLVTADCADFTGASTAGSTLVQVKDISYSIDGGTLDTVVTLVQGSTAAEHFTLDPASTYYGQTAAGPAIRKPVVAYYFVYDEANQRHVLVGAPTDEPFQVGTFATSAQEAWRATTGSWLTRQADLRAMPGGLETSRGIWARVGAQSGEREVATSYSTGGVSLDYDLTQKQRIAHLVFGGDFLGATRQDSAFVLGGMVGFVRSDVEFEATPTEAVTTGFVGGLYASYVAGPLFVDGLFNANILHVKADAPQMGLGLDVPMKFDLKSLGGQVEAGWRIPMGSLFVEPLVGASYVVTMFDGAEVPGGSGSFDFEETKSLRLGGGARVGLDSDLMGVSASYSLTGRYWNDSEGGSSATITTASGSSALLDDDFGGGFSEVVGSVNLYSDGGGVSGFVNLGGKFADGYEAIDGSVGVRVRW